MAETADIVVAVLATLDSKGAEARFLCQALERAGVRPWLVDLSLRPHEAGGAPLTEDQVTGGAVAQAAGSSWRELAAMDRARASETMIAGGSKILLDRHKAGAIAGVIGLGGANGTAMACAMMRALPPLLPKIMVSAVAATAAVEWYVAESDIAMFPSIGDILLNRVTRGVMENAAQAVAMVQVAVSYIGLGGLLAIFSSKLARRAD